MDDSLRPVALARYALMKQISSERNIPIPEEFVLIMESALHADWQAVSEGYEKVWRRSHWYESEEPNDPRISNELWHPLHETCWTFQCLKNWPCGLVPYYLNAVLTVMPPDSILFVGSDSARFLVDSLAPQFGRGDLAFISQNALVDVTYMDYLRDLYGEVLWIPDQNAYTDAFQQYVEQVRKTKGEGECSVDADGCVSVGGTQGVLEINGILARMIAQSNGLTRRIFVDEVYVISWMTPRLSPRGILMELMPEPVEGISKEEVKADCACWEQVEAVLAASREQADVRWAGRAFSGLRTAIAGLYVYHQMPHEAEAAFRQAMRLSEDNPAPAYQLAKRVLEPQGRKEEAQEILKGLQTRDPDHSSVQN
ncbi:MAG: tetratricopeptide repeat protein [Kiritimatiellae bacterium]|nr:tetratricopeptide repeat protein [Kiritimatiellia bacterium]